MKKAINLTGQEFESSSGRTPQYLTWHRTFKREFTKFLQARGVTEIAIGKPNHFDMSGFFKAPNGQLWYFSIGDLRGFKENMLIRTAKHNRDFTGGMNQYATLRSEQEFTDQFDRITKRGDVPSTGNLVDDINAAQVRFATA